MPQSDAYKYREEIDFLGDIIGGDLARDLIRVSVEESDASIGLDGQVEADIVAQTLAELSTDIAAALQSNATDELRVKGVGAFDVSGATVDVQEATPLDVSATEVDVDLNSQTLGSVAVQEASPLDVSGATVTVDPSPNAGTTAFENGTALGSGGTLSNSLSLVGAEQLVGRVVRASTSYDVHVDWEDSAGNVLFTTDVATGVAAGTETDINISPAESPYCTVRVEDAGSASGAVTASLHLR